MTVRTLPALSLRKQLGRFLHAGETPLGLAAGAAQLEVIKLLVEEGAMLGLTNSMPQPLHRSAATGDMPRALLIEVG